ncbi:hypothetical protein [Streptosporangium canum]|nr:hypothetical protein [Streptosporangium canum]
MNRVRSGARAAGPSSTPIPPGYARQVARPPCPHGVPGGHLPRPGTDTPACPQCRHATASAPPTTPQMHQRTLDAARDLATLRETLASLSSRPGLRRPALTIRPPGEAGPSPQVQAAHHYLTGRDDFDVWMNAARQRLGADATTGQVMVLAAELAKGE